MSDIDDWDIFFYFDILIYKTTREEKTSIQEYDKAGI